MHSQHQLGDRTMKKIFAMIILVLGFVSGGLCIYAGNQLGASGQFLTTLSSQGGNSVAEVYYQQMGKFGIAYAYLAYAMGVAAAMLGIGFASVLLSKSEKTS
jgi:hypothetical protein